MREFAGRQANIIFLPIPIISFVGGSRAVVDLFIKLSENHFVKVVNSGADFDLKQLSRFENRAVTHLYVKKEDYKKFADESLKIAEAVISSNANVRQKMAVLLRSSQHIFTEIAGVGIDKNVLNHALQINQSTLAIIATNPDILSILDELSKCNHELVRHSMATSILSGMIVQALKSPHKDVALVALGGMLHDVGLSELPYDLIIKPRQQMIAVEQEIYDSHPLRGYMKLKTVPNIPPQVLAIVYEHHESPTGFGYPRKLKGDKISPLSRVVTFADQLAELVVKSEYNEKPQDLKIAIDFLFTTKKNDFLDIDPNVARRLLAYDSIKNAT